MFERQRGYGGVFVRRSSIIFVYFIFDLKSLRNVNMLPIVLYPIEKCASSSIGICEHTTSDIYIWTAQIHLFYTVKQPCIGVFSSVEIGLSQPMVF